jgi:hypothetical protein
VKTGAKLPSAEIAADTLERRLTYALRLSGGPVPQVIIVRDEAEKREARAFLKGKAGAEMLQIETQAENHRRHRHHKS